MPDPRIDPSALSPEDQAKFLQSDIEKRNELTSLIQSQLGKTVDADMDSVTFENQETLAQIQEELGIEGKFEDVDDEVIFVNENLDRAMAELPGIFCDFYDGIRANADNRSTNLLSSSLPLRFIHNIENRGLILGSAVKGIMGIQVKTSVSENDWNRSLELVKQFPEPLKDRVANIITAEEEYVDKINEVIAHYQSENRPSVQDCLDRRSISEPILQFLVGGSTHEGLSYILSNVGSPKEVPIGEQPVTEKGTSVQLKVSVGDFETMREGSKVSMDYLRFISSIFEKCPDCRVKRRAINLEEATQRYLDAEWQRKDEAITIAERARNVLTHDLAFLRSLQQ